MSVEGPDTTYEQEQILPGTDIRLGAADRPRLRRLRPAENIAELLILRAFVVFTIDVGCLTA